MYDVAQPGLLNHRKKKSQSPEPPDAPKEPPKRSKKLFYLLLAVFLGLLAALASLFFIIRAQEQPPPPVPAAQVAPPASPPAPLVPARDAPLEKLLSSWAQAHPANDWSMAVLGLGQDTRYGEFKSGTVFYSASVYKLLLTYPLFQNLTLEQAKNSQLSVAGGSRNLLDCVSDMLRLSDNPCGHAVGDRVGWAHADEQLNKLGLSNTKLNYPTGSQTSAGDVALFLKAMYNNRLFEPETKNYLIDVLQRQTWRDGIVAGCKGCTVANKTGDLGVRHDAAIVRYNGGAYILVIFTDGAPYGQIAGLTSQVHSHMSAGD